MRLVLLMALSFSLLSACKFGGARQSESDKTSSISASEDDDEGTIDVPKELEPHIAISDTQKLDERLRLSREKLSKILNPGNILELRLSGAKSVTISLVADLRGKPLLLEVQGSQKRGLQITEDRVDLQLPLDGNTLETVKISLPDRETRNIQISSIRSSEGELLEWRIR